MGLLIEGQWHDHWYDTAKTGGHFVRQDSAFRHSIGSEAFPVEAGRYHLYLSHACPWAHRTAIFRKLKGLEDIISVSFVKPIMLENGWEFEAKTGDPLYHYNFLHQVYTRTQKHYSGRVTVPVLWDKQQHCIVNNESSEIIRMLNSVFNEITGNKLDFYPKALQAEIDTVNERVYHKVNNGVYKAGFATQQHVYQEEVLKLFETLDWLEERLGHQRYLVGNQVSEADIRLFTTLIRFDAVYVGHFKCNLKRIVDYPNLQNYLKEVYHIEGIAETVNMAEIKSHYYQSHLSINPSQIVPEGPTLDFETAHDRERFQ